MASVDGEHALLFQDMWFAWDVKALFSLHFPVLKSSCSYLGAMWEQEPTTRTLYWFLCGYFQTAPSLEPILCLFFFFFFFNIYMYKRWYNIQESWGWEAQVLGQCLQISAYFLLRDCGRECIPTVSCLFCSSPALFGEILQPVLKSRQLLGWHLQLGSASSSSVCHFQALHSTHSFGSCTVWSCSEFRLVLSISVHCIAKRNLIQMGALFLAPELSCFIQPISPKSPDWNENLHAS